jgi:hypothetical protein
MKHPTLAERRNKELPDDRITCNTCAHRRLGKCEVKGYAVVVRLMRCEHYQPTAQDADKRKGMQRWPHLAAKRS